MRLFTSLGVCRRLSSALKQELAGGMKQEGSPAPALGAPRVVGETRNLKLKCELGLQARPP